MDPQHQSGTPFLFEVSTTPFCSSTSPVHSPWTKGQALRIPPPWISRRFRETTGEAGDAGEAGDSACAFQSQGKVQNIQRIKHQTSMWSSVERKNLHPLHYFTPSSLSFSMSAHVSPCVFDIKRLQVDESTRIAMSNSRQYPPTRVGVLFVWVLWCKIHQNPNFGKNCKILYKSEIQNPNSEITADFGRINWKLRSDCGDWHQFGPFSGFMQRDL